ncbi:hypothetical protein ACDA63_02235 [Uliginosibacterium sp. sgz301328]|uniref:hypothetical protein n=1 Tax=Uliginosibacterium sp. sgz301328 TaxID=3243764 RepID=UPI00359DC814
MHIVIIGWLFVAVMLAISQTSLVGAAITFIMWGLLPAGLITYLFGRRKRKGERKGDKPD